jgi:hypothetical protein
MVWKVESIQTHAYMYTRSNCKRFWIFEWWFVILGKHVPMHAYSYTCDTQNPSRCLYIDTILYKILIPFCIRFLSARYIIRRVILFYIRFSEAFYFWISKVSLCVAGYGCACGVVIQPTTQREGERYVSNFLLNHTVFHACWYVSSSLMWLVDTHNSWYHATSYIIQPETQREGTRYVKFF